MQRKKRLLWFTVWCTSCESLNLWQKVRILSSETDRKRGEALIQRYRDKAVRQDLPWRKSNVASFDLFDEPFFLDAFQKACVQFIGESTEGKNYNDAQLCTYGIGDGFDAHLDLDDDNKGRFRRLTMVLLLSDQFEGGHFLANGEKVSLDCGEAIIFDAAKVEHQVVPVSSGHRYSLVCGLFWQTRA